MRLLFLQTRHTQEQDGLGSNVSSQRDGLMQEICSIDTSLAEIERAFIVREQRRAQAACTLKKLEAEVETARREHEFRWSAVTIAQESLGAHRRRVQEVSLGVRHVARLVVIVEITAAAYASNMSRESIRRIFEALRY